MRDAWIASTPRDCECVKPKAPRRLRNRRGAICCHERDQSLVSAPAWILYEGGRPLDDGIGSDFLVGALRGLARPHGRPARWAGAKRMLMFGLFDSLIH